MHFIFFTISLAFAAGNTDFLNTSNIGSPPGYDSRVPQQPSIDQDYTPQAEASVAPKFYGATDNIPTPNNGIATWHSYPNFQAPARMPPSVWSVYNVFPTPRPSQDNIPPEYHGPWGYMPQPKIEVAGMPANSRRYPNHPGGIPRVTWSVDHTSSREMPQHARELHDYTPSGSNRVPFNVPQRKDEITKKSNTTLTPSRAPPMLWNQSNATQQQRPRQQEPLGNFPQPNIMGMTLTEHSYPNFQAPARIPPRLWSASNVFPPPRPSQGNIPPEYHGSWGYMPQPKIEVAGMPANSRMYPNHPPMLWNQSNATQQPLPRQQEPLGNFPQPNIIGMTLTEHSYPNFQAPARIPPRLWSASNVFPPPRPSQGNIPPEYHGSWGYMNQPKIEITGMPANSRRYPNHPGGIPPVTWSVDHTSSREMPQHARELHDYTPSGSNRVSGNVPQRKDEITKKSNTTLTPSRTPTMLWNQSNATQQPLPRQQEPLGNFPQPNIIGMTSTKHRYPNITIPRGLQDYTPPVSSKSTGNIPQANDEVTRKPDITRTHVTQQPQPTQGYIPPGSFEATGNITQPNNDVDITPRPLRADNTSHERVPQQSRVAQEITPPGSSGASSSISHPKEDVQLIPAATGIYSSPLIAITPR